MGTLRRLCVRSGLCWLLLGCEQPQSVLEHEPRVRVRWLEGEAELEVTRTFRNVSTSPQTCSELLDAPEGAVATALELRVDGASPAKRAELRLMAEVGAFQAGPLSFDGSEPRAALAKQWDSLFLDIAPLPQGRDVTVSYVLRAPAMWTGGRWNVVLGDRRFETRRSSFGEWQSRWATKQMPSGRSLWQLEIDAAERLGELPVGASVVALVDASVSQGLDGVARQLAVIPPLMARFPGAAVEVIVYRRHAERVFGEFVGQSELRGRLPTELSLQNGSNLDEALRLATQLLEGRSGPRRVIAFSDGRLREALDVSAARVVAERLPEDVILHVVDVPGGSGPVELERLDLPADDGANDDDPRVMLVRPRGGIVASVSGDAFELAESEAALLHLVRPMRLDGLRVESEFEVSLDSERLDEGEGLRLLEVSEKQAPEGVQVHGWIWGRHLERASWGNEQNASRLTAWALGNDALELSDEEELFLARESGAVSSQTVLVTGPRLAPLPLSSWTRTHGRAGSGVYSWSCGGARRRISPVPPLKEAARSAIEGCVATQTATVKTVAVELTGTEIVDLRVDVEGSPAMRSCLVEALWSLRLDESFSAARGWHDAL